MKCISLTTCVSYLQKIECFIDDVCYKNGSVDFDLTCKMCLASSSNKNWTAVRGRYHRTNMCDKLCDITIAVYDLLGLFAENRNENMLF